MRNFSRWIQRVVFWGFIISLIIGFAVQPFPTGFTLEGHVLVQIFTGLGHLFGPLWHAISGHHKITVH